MRPQAAMLVCTVCVASTAASPALSQVPALLAPARPAAGGEPTGDASLLSGYLASMPVRLSLEGSFFPEDRGFPNCETREEAAGNALGGGIPVQHVASIRLVPNLVLSGFTRVGCPIDAGIGGALSYAIPLRPSMWLVLSAGAFGTPAFPQTLELQRSRSTVDAVGTSHLMWQAPSGRAFSLGVDANLGAGRGLVTFGSGF